MEFPSVLLFAEGYRFLSTVNASLNGLATILLALGYIFIRSGREQAHKYTMLSAFGVSVVFLICYLIYHYHEGSVAFPGTGLIRVIYLVILISHIILAAVVPFLAIWTIYLGLRDYREKHRKIAKITFPIWMYVSVTGVIIYLMLYHLYPAA